MLVFQDCGNGLEGNSSGDSLEPRSGRRICSRRGLGAWLAFIRTKLPSDHASAGGAAHLSGKKYKYLCVLGGRGRFLRKNDVADT